MMTIRTPFGGTPGTQGFCPCPPRTTKRSCVAADACHPERQRGVQGQPAPMSALESPSVTKIARVNTVALKSGIDSVCDGPWSGGLSNPLEVILENFHQIKQAVSPGQAA